MIAIRSCTPITGLFQPKQFSFEMFFQFVTILILIQKQGILKTMPPKKDDLNVIIATFKKNIPPIPLFRFCKLKSKQNFFKDSIAQSNTIFFQVSYQICLCNSGYFVLPLHFLLMLYLQFIHLWVKRWA